MSGAVTQISLFSVLLCGKYNGFTSVREVKQFGNLGIATMNMLDGEMIMVDGVVYQARTDDRVYLPSDDETVPFGTVIDFHPDRVFGVKGIPDFETFEREVDELCPARNLPLAVRFKGSFSGMKFRSVDPQKNGVRLAKATENEVRFTLAETEGDLLGFRLPEYIRGINAPGWHLHYLDSARKHGGHVINFTVDRGTLEVCYGTDYRIHFPSDPSFLTGLDLGRDFTEDLKKAESER